MISNGITLLVLGCIFLYLASEKAVPVFENDWFKNIKRYNPALKIVGILMLIGSLFIVYPILGVISAIIFWLFTISITMSLIILFVPIKKIGYLPLLCLVILSFLIEVIFI